SSGGATSTQTTCGGVHLCASPRRKFLRRQAERKPKLALVRMPGIERKLEIARHHTDHGVRLAVEKDLVPQHVRIAVETVLPHAIAQHRHLLAFVIFLLRKCAPHQWWYSKGGKNLSAHPRPIHRRRIARVG